MTTTKYPPEQLDFALARRGRMLPARTLGARGLPRRMGDRGRS